jgi:uncharacterized repeat protein (TIGR01451 family)
VILGFALLAATAIGLLFASAPGSVALANPLADGTPAPKGLGPQGPTLAPTFKTVNCAPLTILVAADGSAQVQYAYVPPVSPNGQFYPAGQSLADMGIFLWIGSSAYGPDFGTRTSAYGSPPLAFTQLSQGNVSGSGTSGDPWVVTETLSAGVTGAQILQKITCVNGQQYYRMDSTIANTSNNPINVTYFHAGDIYLKGSDSGYGYYDPGTGAIGGKNQTQDWFVLFVPSTPATKYEENDYSTIWNKIGQGGAQGSGFASSYRPADFIDNGAGLQWSNIAVLAGQSTTISDFVSFGTTPIAVNPQDLSINKSALPNPVLVGTNLTFQLVVTNTGTLSATNVMVTDTLPANVNFVSAIPSQGSCSLVAGVVKCSLGNLLAGASATINIVVVPTALGPLSNTATVAGNESESNTTNNTSTANVTVISLNPPAQVPEGDTLLLVGTGLAGLLGYAGLRWRARRLHRPA